MACRPLSRSEAQSRCFGSSQGFRWVNDKVRPRVLLSAFSPTLWFVSFQPCVFPGTVSGLSPQPSWIELSCPSVRVSVRGWVHMCVVFAQRNADTVCNFLTVSSLWAPVKREGVC